MDNKRNSEVEFRESLKMYLDEGIHPVMVCFICEKEIKDAKEMIYLGQGLYKHRKCNISKYKGYQILGDA